MATEYVFLSGKGMWARTQRPDEWGNYSIQLRPDNASLEKVRELKEQGVKNNIKKDDDGFFITYRRPQQKMIRGKVIGFTPVEVVDKDGKPIDVGIGNGSDVTIKLEVYQHGTPGGGKAKAARLMGVRIDNLVPFEKDKDYDEDRQEQIDGLAEQPAQHF